MTLTHLMPWDRPQHGELGALYVEAEQVHLVGDVGGKQQTAQGVALNILPIPQLFWDTFSNLELGFYQIIFKCDKGNVYPL